MNYTITELPFIIRNMYEIIYRELDNQLTDNEKSVYSIYCSFKYHIIPLNLNRLLQQYNIGYSRFCDIIKNLSTKGLEIEIPRELVDTCDKLDLSDHKDKIIEIYKLIYKNVHMSLISLNNTIYSIIYVYSKSKKLTIDTALMLEILDITMSSTKKSNKIVSDAIHYYMI